jgi:hypothetical protein
MNLSCEFHNLLISNDLYENDPLKKRGVSTALCSIRKRFLPGRFEFVSKFNSYANIAVASFIVNTTELRASGCSRRSPSQIVDERATT